MGKLIDLTGQRFGRLTVIEKSPSRRGDKTWWSCKCDCGSTLEVWSVYLRNGTTKSCGCLNREMCSARLKAYRKRNGADGRSKTRLHSIWAGMKERCLSPGSHAYALYGGRGITVCDEWRNSFDAFRDWALTHGYSEDLSIDRIDVDGDYCPENCRWADAITQSNNTRCNHMLTYSGRTMSVSRWAVEIGISRGTLVSRLSAGWSVQQAIETPVEHKYASSFTLEFLGETDDLVELDLSSLTDSVNLISPAHLRFIIAGLTWERFEAVNMTWQKLEDMNMTWERLEKSVPIIGSKGD